MRLSEAIRLGATMKPQAFGAMWKDGGSCARGAACDAIGIDSWWDSPWVTWATLKCSTHCPECGHYAHLAAIVAYHLNDYHRWSRERIADFIELHEGLPLPAATEDRVKVAQ